MRQNVWTVFVALMVLITTLLVAPATSQVNPEITKHFGMCDASAAVAVGPTMFVVANDEDNVLRVYRRDTSGEMVHTLDLTSFLKADMEHPEADIEGATRIGERVYWITSHGTNKNGEPRPSRHRLFATEVNIAGDQVTITSIGRPYKDLVKDLAKTPALKDYKLGDAAKRPPEQVKKPNQVAGLNIEGLSATPHGTLLIAFRNPIPNGKALLVPLENPKEVIEKKGQAATLGKPILLSLGGRGIRSIEYFEAWGKYLIVAGPPNDTGDFTLYQWSGASSEVPEPIPEVTFQGLHPEALITYPGERTKIQILSDDGEVQIEGRDCKHKKVEPAKKSFRSVWGTP
jgi:Protein of unknown function (DUF3616)